MIIGYPSKDGLGRAFHLPVKARHLAILYCCRIWPLLKLALRQDGGKISLRVTPEWQLSAHPTTLMYRDSLITFTPDSILVLFYCFRILFAGLQLLLLLYFWLVVMTGKLGLSQIARLGRDRIWALQSFVCVFNRTFLHDTCC